jgi:hypothetical protein
MIEDWRRAQARAHAAEVRVVHAYSRFLDGMESEAPLALHAEAQAIRQWAAERLQRIFDMVLDAKGASAP